MKRTLRTVGFLLVSRIILQNLSQMPPLVANNNNRNSFVQFRPMSRFSLNRGGPHSTERARGPGGESGREITRPLPTHDSTSAPPPPSKRWILGKETKISKMSGDCTCLFFQRLISKIVSLQLRRSNYQFLPWVLSLTAAPSKHRGSLHLPAPTTLLGGVIYRGSVRAPQTISLIVSTPLLSSLARKSHSRFSVLELRGDGSKIHFFKYFFYIGDKEKRTNIIKNKKPKFHTLCATHSPLAKKVQKRNKGEGHN